MPYQPKIYCTRTNWLPLTPAFLLFFTMYVLCIFYVEEDSYIYFRIAENIADGYGYVFNRNGEAIEAGSGPLWQYLLALGSALGIDGLILSKIMGGIFGTASVVMVYKIVLRFGSALAASGSAIALACNLPFVWWSGSGLETSAFVFFQLTCLYLVLNPKEIGIYARWLFVGLLFIRPEAIFVLCILLAYLFFTGRFSSFSWVILILTISLASYSIFRYYYFKDIQISPFYAKINRMEFSWEYAIGVMHQFRMWYGLIFIFAGGYFSLQKKAHKEFILITSLFIFMLYFAASNNEFKPNYRFFSHAFPHYFVLVGISFSFLASSPIPHFRTFATTLFCLFVLAICWVPRVTHINEKKPNPIYESLKISLKKPSALIESYNRKLTNKDEITAFDIALQKRVPYVVGVNYQATVGKFISLNYPKEITIGYDQMGQTPYFAGKDKVFIDFLGLVSHPIALAYFNQGAKESSIKSAYKAIFDPFLAPPYGIYRNTNMLNALAYVQSKNPELIMIHLIVAALPQTLTSKVAQSDWLRDNYKKKYRLAGWIDVYERNDTLFPLLYKDDLPLLEFVQY